MNAAVRVEASAGVALADAERALEVKEDGRAAQRRALASAAAVTVEAQNRSAESPGDRRLAEAVVDARRAEAIETESLTAWDRNVEDAKRRVAEARRAEDQAELEQVKSTYRELIRELRAFLPEGPPLYRLTSEYADRGVDLAEALAANFAQGRELAARLGVSDPVPSVGLPVIRVACGLHLADAIGGVPDHPAEDLRSHLGLVRALRALAAARLDSAELGPLVDRLLLEIDCAIGTTTGRWLEPLADPGWSALHG